MTRHPRRRPLVALVSSLLLLGVLVPCMALASPKFVRLSFEDPQQTSTHMTVTWHTEDLKAPSTVEYGLSQAYGKVATGSAVGAGALQTIHTVQLQGLVPDTLYHYRVGGPGDYSPDFTFRTGPATICDPFRFVALGDNRGDTGNAPSPHWKPILEEVASHEPHFLIMTGDQVKDGDEVDQWLDFLEVSELASPYIPFMPSLGNHDTDIVEGDGALYNQIFSLPTNVPGGTEDYHYFKVGNALFVSLSMVTYSGGNTPFADQAAWLDQVFTENDATWRFVYFHHPIYSGVLGEFFGLQLFEGNHPPNEKGQNAALVPVFDKHHVDIVFNGHNHFYQRFEPMVQGPNWEHGVPVDDYADGTVYMITGGAGALTYDLSFLGIDLPKLICLKEGSVQCSGLHHYVVVDVDGLDLHVTVHSSASQLTDSNAPVEIVDEFWISKDGFLDCSEAPVADEGGGSDIAEAEDVIEGETLDDSSQALDLGPSDGEVSGPPDPGPPPSDGGADQDASPRDPDTKEPRAEDTSQKAGDSAPASAQDLGGAAGTDSTPKGGCGGCQGARSSAPGLPNWILLLSVFVLIRLRRRNFIR